MNKSAASQWDKHPEVLGAAKIIIPPITTGLFIMLFLHFGRPFIFIQDEQLILPVTTPNSIL